MSKIKYKGGYKYVLVADYKLKLPFKPLSRASSEFISLRGNLLIIRRGYAWDGASGCAIDSAAFMRGSLVHDALYQCMREGVLSRSWRENVDRLLRSMCVADGMWRVRAWWVYRAVRKFGKKSSVEGRAIKTAP